MGGALVAVAEDAESTDWDSANTATPAGSEPNLANWAPPSHRFIFCRSKIYDLRSKFICSPRSWPHRYRHETPIQPCSSMRPGRLNLQPAVSEHMKPRNSHRPVPPPWKFPPTHPAPSKMEIEPKARTVYQLLQGQGLSQDSDVGRKIAFSFQPWTYGHRRKTSIVVASDSEAI